MGRGAGMAGDHVGILQIFIVEGLVREHTDLRVHADVAQSALQGIE